MIQAQLLAGLTRPLPFYPVSVWNQPLMCAPDSDLKHSPVLPPLVVVCVDKPVHIPDFLFFALKIP